MLSFVRSVHGFAMAENITALTALLQEQLQASAEREQRLSALVEKTLKALVPMSVPTASVTPPSASTASISSESVSADRPCLLSASMAEFSVWEEAWQDCPKCQHIPAVTGYQSFGSPSIV